MNTLRLRHVLLKGRDDSIVVIVIVSRDFRFNYHFLIKINTHVRYSEIGLDKKNFQLQELNS